jgi:hypothetical protein
MREFEISGGVTAGFCISPACSVMIVSKKTWLRWVRALRETRSTTLKLYNVHKKLEDIRCYDRLFDQAVTDVNVIIGSPGHRVVAVDHLRPRCKSVQARISSDMSGLGEKPTPRSI